jgi:hypothetical protein
MALMSERVARRLRIVRRRRRHRRAFASEALAAKLRLVQAGSRQGGKD